MKILRWFRSVFDGHATGGFVSGNETAGLRLVAFFRLSADARGTSELLDAMIRRAKEGR